MYIILKIYKTEQVKLVTNAEGYALQFETEEQAKCFGEKFVKEIHKVIKV